jgi:prevent-host-death family protein
VKSIDEAEAQARFDEILDEAQQQPIVIRRQGRGVAAIVSTADYERLRALNVQSFLGLSEEVAREAAANGLTETGLADLLGDS